MANLNSESYHSLIGFLTPEYLGFLKHTHTDLSQTCWSHEGSLIQHVIAVNWVTLTGNSDCFALFSLNVMPAFFVQELIMDSDVIATQKCHHVI